MPRGQRGRRPFALVVTPESAGWGYSGLRVLDLPVGARVEFDTGDDEMLVLPLAGGCDVTCDDERFTLTGRRVGVLPGHRLRLRAARRDGDRARAATAAGSRCPSARAERRLPFRYGPAEDVPVELRGAGQASRQVNNFCTPETFEADRLIAVEVLTPGGNWSSYPPHKHDEPGAGRVRPGGDLLLRGGDVAGRARRAAATSGCTATRTARSTSAPRCAAATSC